jgi:predicted house-cleaning noncanonical NTP pyrophosphatase (MazG superfamily)
VTEKLVRDRIPDIIRGAGGAPQYRVLGSGERLHWLLEKLHEEVAELALMPCLSECADVYEVLLAIAAQIGETKDRLVATAEEKANRHGAFSEGILLRTSEDGR